MKKIISFFILLLSSIFFLAGCSELASVSYDIINNTDINEFISIDDVIDGESEYITEETTDTSDSESEYTEEETTDTSDSETEYTTEETTDTSDSETQYTAEENVTETAVFENDSYTDKESVAFYIHTYGKLPSNYITKNKAREQGWNNQSNTMAEALPGMSIGGDNFGNYEGLLPKKQGRTYKECDIDYEKGSRNAKRIVYSNDGLIFYTEDHYNSFVQLY